jgi:hypothetical protein
MGVSSDWSFEEELLKLNPGLTVHAYDHTVGEKVFLSSLKYSLLRFLLRRVTWAELSRRRRTYSSYKQFFQSNSKVRHFQERVFNRTDNPIDATVDRMFSRLEGKQNLIVKMDIEGTEYRVIDDILSHAGQICLMAIEFHDTEPLRKIFLENISRISQHFDLVHLHGNNWGGVARDGLPEVLEATFLHRRFSQSTARRNKLPVAGLDFPNNPRKADYELLFA